MIYTLEQVSGSGGQDNRRNLAVNVHVMKRLLLCVFPHAAACQTCRGVGLALLCESRFGGNFSVAMYLYLYMYVELTEWATR